MGGWLVWRVDVVVWWWRLGPRRSWLEAHVGAHARPLGRVPRVCRARIDLVVNMQRLAGCLGWGWVSLKMYVFEWVP